MSNRIIQTIINLLEDVMERHETEYLVEYSNCDTAPCEWCTKAARVLEGLRNDFGRDWNDRMDEIGAERGTYEDLEELTEEDDA